MSDGKPAKGVRVPIVIENDLSVDFATDQYRISETQMFHVTRTPGLMVVHLLAEHPLYDALSRLLITEGDAAADKPGATMEDALTAVRGLLVSWARAEVEAAELEPEKHPEFERCSQRWGEVAARLFRDPEE